MDSTPMSCSKCGGRTETIRERGGSFDRCTSCKGMWFDLFTLEAILDRNLSARWVGDIRDFMNPVESEETSLSCPRCSSRLFRCTHADITVEWCRACRGIFLDEDEPRRIMTWRRANLRSQRTQVAMEVAKDGGRVAVNVALVALVSEALEAIFGGALGRRAK